MSDLRQAGAGDQAHIAGSEDGNFHGFEAIPRKNRRLELSKQLDSRAAKLEADDTVLMLRNYYSYSGHIIVNWLVVQVLNAVVKSVNYI